MLALPIFAATILAAANTVKRFTGRARRRAPAVTASTTARRVIDLLGFFVSGDQESPPGMRRARGGGACHRSAYLRLSAISRASRLTSLQSIPADRVSCRLAVAQSLCATTATDRANAMGAVARAAPTIVMARALTAKPAFWMAFMMTSPVLLFSRPQNTLSRRKLQGSHQGPSLSRGVRRVGHI